MIFKKDWEKTGQYFQVSPQTIQRMVEHALPDAKLSGYEMISGGCANLNVKINLLNELEPKILRIYFRDKGAAYREQKIAELINGSLPVPEVFFVGDLDGYRFAITQYKAGITLRDLLLNSPIQNLESVMVETGLVLAKIQDYRFRISGFFDQNLDIGSPITQQGHLNYVKLCLKHPTTVEMLGKTKISKIKRHLKRYGLLFPDQKQNHLVHADYDPANILVQQLGKEWKISAILDWEFSFSGSPLCDVATMLRYSHHMPPTFEDSFLKGLKQGGVHLPDDWPITVHLLNLLSLLDCLIRCPPKVRPNQCQDICDLITYIIQKLDVLENMSHIQP